METLLKESISESDLRTFEKKYNEERRQSIKNPKTKFDYAWCLIRSKYPADVRKGVIFMEELFKDGDESLRRDYVYYMAFGKCKLKEYKDAKRYIKGFLEVEPKNRQARELHDVIMKRSKQEDLTGTAIITGVAAFIVGVGILMTKK
ncbi:mitochondrial fission 1 protein-like [Tropilaelaps mercedesae]|uniref:Mitochondrial fission 1 protein n=1 Tax=Tropilaelaps mercedesae TaxID=418985 RepID=A0A1V9XZW0_9ACAR|nr:mitochondrial fission 1 protein-like [Tropilaelaps mercedesae]